MPDRPKTSRKHWLLHTILSGIAVGAVVAAYGRYVEPYWVEVTHHEIDLKGLPEALDGTKVVQLSDIHCGDLNPDSTIVDAVAAANMENPDIIVLTGDYINWPPSNIHRCLRLLSKLKAKQGVYAVLGNHDYHIGVDGIHDRLVKSGIQVVVNGNKTVLPGLQLIGLDDSKMGHPDITTAWAGTDKDAAQVVLVHSSDGVRAIRDRGCLILTGHTHGGEVAYPFVHATPNPRLRGCRYLRGRYQVGDSTLYVNRGIGVVNPLKIRFMSRPEVAVFVLHPKR